MPQVSILKPTDQPTGVVRLLDELKANLKRDDLHTLRIIVAFAKLGPLVRLDPLVQNWRKNGKTIEVVLGIDQRGTSKEALEYALTQFDKAYVSHAVGPFSPTFHPKIYHFTGDQKAVAFVGSNNLTVGGTETNFETYVKLELDLPADKTLQAEIVQCWTDAQKIALQLTNQLLSQLESSGLVESEGALRKAGAKKAASLYPTTQAANVPSFPKLTISPPSSLPKASLKTQTGAKKVAPAKKAISLPKASPTVFSAHLAATALVIQIIPHHNGEVFLSKTAIDQNPAFFGWPFTGQTTPKKGSNKPYPQRVPDPVVNLALYDSNGNLIVKYSNYGLNTVYYEPKSEIRITVPQDFYQSTQQYTQSGPYPIMVITEAPDEPPYDYDIEVYIPGSQQYALLLAVCNQTMPSGGKPVAREFGWL